MMSVPATTSPAAPPVWPSRMKERLFKTPAQTLVSVLLLAGLAWIAWELAKWALVDADFRGKTAADCQGDGACWVFVRARFQQFMAGFYPASAYWRLWVVLGGWLVMGASCAWAWRRHRLALGGLVMVVLLSLILSGMLLHGGLWGLPVVETAQWGGLMLTLVLSVTGIVFSIPLGVLLAFGRRSSLPIVRWVATAFIEFWRGVPLVTVLFMASVMLPLFMPEGVTLDRLLRALVGVVMFSSAYLAEVVRGGLQAVSPGQAEAARSLALSRWQTVYHIVLPQALGKVVPGIINVFIALVKDTSLVLIIGMFDLLGMVQTASSDPQWLGYHKEGYFVAACFFWLLCFGLSRFGARLERNTGG